jgi:hypothetical protein
MFRLLGFLIGSAAAITIILLVLGTPDFHLADPEIDQQRFDAAVEKLKEKQQEVAEVAEVIVEEVAKTVDELQDNIETVAEKAVPELTALLDGESDAANEFTTKTLPDVPGLANDYPTLQEELQWYSFWNPFRSQIAARGFVMQLEKVTGLDYRVVKVKTGVFEVAFAYDNDVERRTKLSQISAATGLELPDS